MESVTRDDYNYLCTLLLNECNQYVNRNDLDLLKLTYEREVNSVRRLNRVKNVKDLITLLEKRGCLSESNISILEDIAKTTESLAFLLEINNRRNGNIAVAQPHAINGRQTGNDEAAHAINIDTKTMEDQVRELIINELGIKWVDFARALQVRESRLDQLRMLYPNREEQCIKEVLSDHKNNAHAREWKPRLLDALTEARRNDLRKAIEQLYMTYS